MINWSDYDLPDFRFGKVRKQPSPYTTTEAFSGPLYVEQISDDIPVSWDVEIVCNDLQRIVFQTFLSDINYSGEFVKILRTEAGVVEQEVRIISGIPQPTEIGQNVWSYSFTVYARELNLDNSEPIDSDVLCGEPLALCGEPDAMCGM